MIRMIASYGKQNLINKLKQGTTIVICFATAHHVAAMFEHPTLAIDYRLMDIKRERERVVTAVFDLIHSSRPAHYSNVILYRNHPAIENENMEQLGRELEEAGFLVTLAYREI